MYNPHKYYKYYLKNNEKHVGKKNVSIYLFCVYLHLSFLFEKKTKIALNQVYVPKLALKVKSHKNST